MRVDVSAYRILTAAPESDGTFEWDSTTLVAVHVTAEDKTGFGVSTGNGVVTLDVHQMVVEVGTELGIPSDALAKLPAKAGKLTLMKSDQLSAVQNGIQAVRVLSAWLLVGVLRSGRL